MKNIMLDAIDLKSHSKENKATYKGVMVKTGFFLFVTMIFTILTMTQLPYITNTTGFTITLFISMIVGTISGMMAMRNPKVSKIAGIVYTASQGILLGVIITMVEQFVEGAGVIAIGVTFVILISMLVLYGTGMVHNTPKLRKLMMLLVTSALLISLVSFFILIFNPSFFTVGAGWYINLGISVLFLLFGTLMLINDFDRIQTMVSGGFDKTYEWTAAIGLIATLIFIYVEILRLIMILANSRSRRNN